MGHAKGLMQNFDINIDKWMDKDDQTIIPADIVCWYM